MSASVSERRPGIRPGTTLVRRLDRAGRGLFPALSTLAVVVLLAFPLRVPGAPELQQVLALVLVWFWSVYRPGSMPPSAAFATGLLCDLLGPAPPGIAMLTLVTVHGVAVRARTILIRRGFHIIWLALTGIAGASFAVQWVLTTALEWHRVPWAPAIFEWALAAGFYPLVAVVLIRLHTGIAAPERA